MGGIAVLAGAQLVAGEIRNAPEGYEDESGFHIGRVEGNHEAASLRAIPPR